jgi:hypothetical protein
MMLSAVILSRRRRAEICGVKQGIAQEEALKQGMEEKSREFTEKHSPLREVVIFRRFARDKK